MPQPFISVVINNYNYERFLAEAIDSVLAQVYPHCELVVVDDGSTDDSRTLIEGYGNRVVSVYRHNGGQGAAFNSGFAACRGDLVLFLDADDLLLPGALERLAREWRPEYAKIHFQLKMLRHGRVTDELIVAGPLAQGNLVRRQLRGGATPCPPTSGNAYARFALARLLPMPEMEWRLCADAYLNALVPVLGPVHAIDDPLGVYRVHGENNWYQDALDLSACWQRSMDQSVRYLGLADVVGRLHGEQARRGWLKTVRATKTRMVMALLGTSLEAESPRSRRRLAVEGVLSAPWAYYHSLPKRALIAFWFILAGIAPRFAWHALVVQALCPPARPRLLRQL